MKKRILLNILALCLMISALSPFASATEANTCGDGLTWEYDDGTLTIHGDGEMDNFSNGAPWAAHKSEITKVVIAGNVTYIGSYAFKNYDLLVGVDFGDALTQIGPYAFASCDGLISITMPETFKIFGEGSFQECSNLEEIHCGPLFPSFRENCMWKNYLTIYYPAERPWKAETIKELVEAFHGRITFAAESAADREEPTEAPTEVPTEPEETVPETTVPETVPPTEATVPVTEPPVTEAPTEVPTEAPTEVPTEAATEPVETLPAQQPEEAGGIPTGLIIIGAVMLFILFGIVMFGAGGKKGKYSRGRKKRR